MSNRQCRILIVTSHPIQYQAPLFRAMSEHCQLRVLFAHRVTPDNQAAAEFGVAFEWDVDLTSGFENHYLNNVSEQPSVNQYDGCDTPEILGEIRDFQPDVVLVYGWHLKCYLQAARACRSLGLPVVARTDSHLMTPRSWVKSILMRAYYPWFLKRFDGFCAAGTMSADYLRIFRVPQSKIKKVPYCIDTRLYQAWNEGDSTLQGLRSNYKIPSASKICLFVGKLVPRKRPEDLIHAVSRLKGHDICCLFVGMGALKESVAQLAEQLNVKAVFAGFVNQTSMPAHYALADVLVLPSSLDTWGLVVNESFACGTPAIVSDVVGCHPELITEGATGFVYSVGDQTELAECIERSLSGQRESFEQACLRVSDSLSPQMSALSMVDALESLSCTVSQ